MTGPPRVQVHTTALMAGICKEGRNSNLDIWGQKTNNDELFV